jgi:hypothetical protein
VQQDVTDPTLSGKIGDATPPLYLSGSQNEAARQGNLALVSAARREQPYAP